MTPIAATTVVATAAAFGTTEANPVGTHHAYERVRQAIVEGRYQPGQRLVEHRVAEELQLSRTPVREALQRLEAEGLVEIIRNRGAVVRTLTRQDINDVYDLRARLESLAAERAAERAKDDPAAMAVLVSANELFREAIPLVGRGDLEGLRMLQKANDRFHGGLVALSGNRRLGQILTHTVSAPLVFISFQQYGRVELERSLMFHDLVLQAVAVGAGDRAGALMAEHIFLGRDALLANLGESAGIATLHEVPTD